MRWFRVLDTSHFRGMQSPSYMNHQLAGGLVRLQRAQEPDLSSRVHRGPSRIQQFLLRSPIRRSTHIAPQGRTSRTHQSEFPFDAGRLHPQVPLRASGSTSPLRTHFLEQMLQGGELLRGLIAPLLTPTLVEVPRVDRQWRWRI